MLPPIDCKRSIDHAIVIMLNWQQNQSSKKKQKEANHRKKKKRDNHHTDSSLGRVYMVKTIL